MSIPIVACPNKIEFNEVTIINTKTVERIFPIPNLEFNRKTNTAGIKPAKLAITNANQGLIPIVKNLAKITAPK
ncbi:MAG: hypothetical protein R2759_13360 [Bacteroidales bacterium]